MFVAPLMAASASTSSLPQSQHTQAFGCDGQSVTSRADKTGPESEIISTKPSLSPSPAIRESPQKIEHHNDLSEYDPVTPRRPSFHSRSLSLQMPTREQDASMVMSAPRIPLSPKLDPASSLYGSPASVIPRRARGGDFSRACTSLHQSTLAESSPDASPIVGRGVNIPQRRLTGHNGMIPDSPSGLAHGMWSGIHGGERTNLSSSVSSINMVESDTDSDESSDLDMDRSDDPVLNTPAASRINALASTQSPGMDWLNKSPASGLNFRSRAKSRPKDRRGRLSRSTRSKLIDGPLSLPIRSSVESSSSYFGMTRQQVRSRRESLSLGTDDLHLSDSEWDAPNEGNTSRDSGTDGASERGVVKRTVTRRSNLLPKTKGFARIKAALMEESDPLHTEARKEAEVIKQVHESDLTYKSGTTTGQELTSEPVEVSAEELSRMPTLSTEASNTSGMSVAATTEPFSQHAKRNSAGLGFWHNFEHTPPSSSERYRTPPPAPLNNDSTSEDFGSMFTPFYDSNGGSLIRHLHRSRSRSVTPLASAASNAHQGANAGDGIRKTNNKRRRDDDFDPASFKRRAVSPGMSAQSSPVIPQSPVLGGEKSWGRPPSKSNGDRSNSGSSSTPKRVGLQGMTEANDGLMGMSID